MSDYLSDVLATDAALDLLGARDLFETDDAVLAGLACLACAVDERPLPQPLAIVVRPPQQARKCGWALSVTVAMTLASSGVAAAVADDPLAPFHFMQSHVTFLQQDPPTGWDLDGSGVVSTLPEAPASAPAGAPATHLARASMGTRGVAAFGRVRTPAAGEVPGSGDGSSGGGSGRSTPGGPGHGGGSGGHRGNGGHGGNGGGTGHPKPPVDPKGPPVGGNQGPGVKAPPLPVSGSPTLPVGGVPGRPTAPIQPIHPLTSSESVSKQPATTDVASAIALTAPTSITLATDAPTVVTPATPEPASGPTVSAPRLAPTDPQVDGAQ